MLNGTYEVKVNGVLNGIFGVTENAEDRTIPIDGTKPSSGKLRYSNNVLDGGCLVIGDYKITFGTDGKVDETVKGDCSDYEFSGEQGNSGNQQTVIPTISSCEGCVFTIDGGELFKDEIVNPDVTLVNDYSDLGDNFYGLVINNNYITNIFVCGIYNNNPYCLEGGDSSKYSHNVEILNDIYGSCGDSNSSDSSCGAAYAGDNGYVGMSGTNGDGYICATEDGYGYMGSGC